MTLARRLLMAAGGGAFPGPSERSLAASGYWNDIADPKAFTLGDKTHFGFVDDAGDFWAAEYDASTGLSSTPFLMGTGSSPSGPVHNTITQIARQSDSRLFSAICSEGGRPYGRVSTNPGDSTAWGSAYLIGPSGVFTYSSLAQLSSEGGAIYWLGTHWSGGVGHLAYMISTDGGATFGAVTDLVSPVSTSQVYHRIGTDWAGRIDVFVTSTDRSLASPSSVYHLYWSGGDWHQTDGTVISASRPFAASAGTLVQDTTWGSARPEGWAYDSAGRPACIVNSRDTGGGTTELVRIARFDGSAWATHAVADSGGQLIASSGLDKSNPNTAYSARLTSGVLEMFRHDSGDDGLTWAHTQLTSGSAHDNDAVDTPVNASRLMALWGYGVYTGPGFSEAVKGWAV